MPRLALPIVPTDFLETSGRRLSNWPEFRKRLQANGAEALAQYTASDDALDVMKLLFTLRHLVHGAALRSTGFDDGKRKVSSLVALPKGEAQSLWNAAQRHGSAEYWGMTQMPGGLMVAPYNLCLRPGGRVPPAG